MSRVSLQVSVRVRPLQPHDGKVFKLALSGLIVDGFRSNIRVPGDQEFEFDSVFGENSSQAEVFRKVGLPLVKVVLEEATNACIFAFGCTGSGKTYSMLGAGGGRAQHDGILPSTVSELFRRIARLENDAKQALGSGAFSAYQVRLSFLEVYCENVFDLLGGPVSSSRDVGSSCALREDASQRVYAEGAKEIEVTSMEQLLELVVQGAKARSTAPTEIHEHSSRSHALLVLTVEHRWRDVADIDTRKIKSQVSRLTMVDLAGAESMDTAHGGSFNSAGAATNVGLLVLGRVLKALSSKTGERIPFRDSTLTRLMQSSLSGNAITHMLACVSPAPHDQNLSIQTLRYAHAARQVCFNVRQAAIDDVEDEDPMVGDHPDPDPATDRRTVWIETTFGDLFARVCGDPMGPLILYIHGSGPANSSMVWNLCALQINELTADPAYFHVSIDCPGYGRSVGNRQSIRSYPGELVLQIVHALGRHSVACLVGSSQGAASAFNVVLEHPELVHTLAVCHPVSHSPERFTAIFQPVLLIYDNEDEGHPVSVGRLVRKYLRNPRYFEFSRSVDGDWESVHMAAEIVKMLQDPSNKKMRRLGGRRDAALPDLTRVAGGYRSWSERHGMEVTPWYGCCEPDGLGGYRQSSVLRVQTQGVTEAEAQTNESAVTAEWRAVIDLKTNTMIYEHIATKRTSRVRPPGARVAIEQQGSAVSTSNRPAGSRSKPSELLSRDTVEPQGSLFEGRRDPRVFVDEEEQARLVAEAERLQKEQENAQQQCDVCQKALKIGAWVRLKGCRCAVCGCCVESTIRYFRDCPRCGEKLITSKGVPTSAAAESSTNDREDPNDECHSHQLLRLQNLIHLRTVADLRIVIEYGNKVNGGSAESGVGRNTYSTFCKAVTVERGCNSKLPRTTPDNAICKVDFNINPDYAKPTAIVKDSGKQGYSFDYAMARTYPCVMTLYFAASLRLPKLAINYFVQDSQVSKRIVVEVKGVPSSKTMIVFEPSAPNGIVLRNGWIHDFGANQCLIEYR